MTIFFASNAQEAMLTHDNKNQPITHENRQGQK
jgi:hypothetical protein